MKEKPLKYRIVGSEELTSICEKYSGKLIDQIDYNDAIIEHLEDDSYALISAYGEKGMIFYDKKIMDSMIRERIYPKETDSNDFFDIYKNEILCFKNDPENGIKFFEEKFKTLTGFSFEYELKKSFLLDLENHLVKTHSNNKGELYELSNVSWVLMNEAIRRALSGKWIFDKEYTLNTYLVPQIVDKDNGYLGLGNFFQDFVTQKERLNIKSYLIMFLDQYIVNRFHPSNINHKEMNENLQKDFDYYFNYYLKKAGEN